MWVLERWFPRLSSVNYCLALGGMWTLLACPLSMYSRWWISQKCQEKKTLKFAVPCGSNNTTSASEIWTDISDSNFSGSQWHCESRILPQKMALVLAFQSHWTVQSTCLRLYLWIFEAGLVHPLSRWCILDRLVSPKSPVTVSFEGLEIC